MNRHLGIRRAVAAVAGTTLLAFSFAACGDDSDANSDSDSSSSSSDGPPKAVAALDAIPGGTTQITLDKGFTDALGTLGLTPGLVGDAELTEAGELRFRSRAATSRSSPRARSRRTSWARSTTTPPACPSPLATSSSSSTT